MCFVLALCRVNPRYPLVVAANRDERRDRPARAPFPWDGSPAIWAGRDESAGGTWLGVNEHGLVAAITNRRDERPVPDRPSRGGLCVGLLRRDTTTEARRWLAGELDARAYNPFNLFWADVASAWVATWRGGVTALGPGVHMITDRGEPNDPSLPIVRRGRELLASVDPTTPDLDALLVSLGHLCADTGGEDPLCRPGGDRGTVSSSLIAVDPSGAVAAYLHAQGPPSVAPYAPVVVRSGLPVHSQEVHL